jgi:hypothetical protein
MSMQQTVLAIASERDYLFILMANSAIGCRLGMGTLRKAMTTA